MYILKFIQGDLEEYIGIFNQKEEGREFLNKIPGYSHEQEKLFVELEGEKEELDLEKEMIDPKKLPEYLEIEYMGKIYPLSKYSFSKNEEILVEWKELTNFSGEEKGMVLQEINISGYALESKDVKDYLKTKKEVFEKTKEVLEKLGYEIKVERDFSYEAILYKKGSEEPFKLFEYLDPYFVYEIENNFENAEECIKGLLD